MSNDKTLKFKQDGSFKILQITDVQDTAKLSTDATNFIDAVLEAEKPDLVVFTGDQIKGYSPALRRGDSKAKVKKLIGDILEPLVRRNVPFTFAFGNHDMQSPVDKKDQYEFYKRFEQCLSENTEGIPGVGNHNLPIYSSDGSRKAFSIYMVDSLGAMKGGGYDPVSKEQIEWYKNTRDALEAENGGNPVPSMLFQHIPVNEMYNCFDDVPKGTKGSLAAHRKYKGHYYILKKEIMDAGGFFDELPCPSDENFGQFDAACEKGDMIAMFFGHDHKNSFVGNYKGIDLAYTPCCGFSVYGPQYNRGIRVIELNENEPKSYKTRVRFYHEFFGNKVKSKLKLRLVDMSPTSIEDAIPMIIEGLLALGVIITGIVLLLMKLF